MSSQPSTGSGVESVHARVIGADQPVLRVDRDLEQHYAASTMKVPVQIAYERLVAAGRLDPEQEVAVDPTLASQVSGQRFTMQESWDQDPPTWAAVGQTVPLGELVRRMVVSSGNLATNLVLSRVGIDEVAAVLGDAGTSPLTTVRRGIEDAPAREAGLDNLVTARDLAQLLSALVTGRLGPVTERVEAVLAGQEHRDGIPAGLPDGVRVGNKTGSVDGVNHDVALVRAPGLPALALAVLITDERNEAARQSRIAEITREVWADFVARHSAPTDLSGGTAP